MSMVGNQVSLNIENDNATASAVFPLFAAATLGSPTTLFTSNAKLLYTPSTGTFSATVFTSLSDESLKDNIVTIKNSVELVKQLRGVEYTWKDNGNASIGLIAQEVEKVLPQLVNESDGIKSVVYANMVGLLIEAIKELNTRISVLESK